MKRIFFVPALLFIVATASAQKDPVRWNFAAKKIDATNYELQLAAQMDEDWHIYSQTTPVGGPVPTSVSFSRNPLVTVKGTVKESGKVEEHFEELFGVKVRQYSEKVVFVQTVTIKAGVKTAVNGSVEYMVCNDRECMPPKRQAFSIALN